MLVLGIVEIIRILIDDGLEDLFMWVFGILCLMVLFVMLNIIFV